MDKMIGAAGGGGTKKRESKLISLTKKGSGKSKKSALFGKMKKAAKKAVPELDNALERKAKGGSSGSSSLLSAFHEAASVQVAAVQIKKLKQLSVEQQKRIIDLENLVDELCSSCVTKEQLSMILEAHSTMRGGRTSSKRSAGSKAAGSDPSTAGEEDEIEQLTRKVENLQTVVEVALEDQNASAKNAKTLKSLDGRVSNVTKSLKTLKAQLVIMRGGKPLPKLGGKKKKGVEANNSADPELTGTVESMAAADNKLVRALKKRVQLLEDKLEIAQNRLDDLESSPSPFVAPMSGGEEEQQQQQEEEGLIVGGSILHFLQAHRSCSRSRWEDFQMLTLSRDGVTLMEALNPYTRVIVLIRDREHQPLVAVLALQTVQMVQVEEDLR